MTTKRKKKKTMSIIFIILLIISGIGGKYLMDKRTEHERQVAFLKEHEAEMTEYIKNKSQYVKNQNYKNYSIKYHWNTVESIQSSAFSTKILSIEVDLYNVNQENIDGFEIYVVPDSVSFPKKVKNIY
jgi:hypothetical protein